MKPMQIILIKFCLNCEGNVKINTGYQDKNKINEPIIKINERMIKLKR